MDRELTQADREYYLRDALEMMEDLEHTASLARQAWMPLTPEQKRYAMYQSQAIAFASTDC